MSCDDTPLIGKLGKFDNLFVNIGYGARGSKQSLAGAEILADLVAGGESQLS